MMAVTGTGILTLSEHELNACKPIQGEGGRAIRAFCPFHGSDKQRSLRVDVSTGRFYCFACGAWGYTEEARRRWRDSRQQERRGAQPTRPRQALRSIPRPKPQKEPEPARPDLPDLMQRFQAALPGSLGEEYLRRRGIPLEVAERHGVGYAAADTWPGRRWKWGRVVFPLTDPGGRIINVYGRAVGANDKVPKQHRHDLLSGDKAYFGGAALCDGEGPLFVCEGPFDALALMAAGVKRATAIIGVKGWRWAWAKDVQAIVLALDGDQAGQAAWQEIARGARLRGKQVYVLPPEAYGGHKDAAAAWAAGALKVGDIPKPAADPVQAERWDEAEAYRLFKEALDATAKAYEIAQPAWCHPLFDAIEKAWDAKDMGALRATTQRAVTLAREVIDRSPPKKGAEQPKKPAKRRYGTDRKDVPRCHGCGAEVQHWTVTRCQHCRNKDREDATRGPRMAQDGF